MFGFIFIALGFSALWLVLGMALRLFRYLRALDITIKNQRRARRESSIGDASQLTGFNGSEMEPLSRELQEMGFVHLGDLISRLDAPPDDPAPLSLAPIADPRPPQPAAPKMVAETETDCMGRVFAHPSHGCYAVLISAVAVSRFSPELNRADAVKVAPFQTAISTVSGQEEDSWGYATHNFIIEPFSLLLRHPRRVSHRLVGARAAQLLERHLAERDDIASRANCQWDKAPSFEKYRELEARGLRHIRRVYERATTLGVAWKLFTYRFSKHKEWMGELPSS